MDWSVQITKLMAKVTFQTRCLNNIELLIPEKSTQMTNSTAVNIDWVEVNLCF